MLSLRAIWSQRSRGLGAGGGALGRASWGAGAVGASGTGAGGATAGQPGPEQGSLTTPALLPELPGRGVATALGSPCGQRLQVASNQARSSLLRKAVPRISSQSLRSSGGGCST